MPPAPTRLFDTHAHFFTDDTVRYPVDVGNSKESAESLLARIATNPVTDTYLLDQWDQCGVVGGAAVQYSSIYKTDNSYAVDVGDAHRDRMTTVLILNAAEPSTPAKLRTLATGHNVSGLRLAGPRDADGTFPWLDSRAALDTWEAADALGLHIALMYYPADQSAAALDRIAALARRFPATNIFLDHCGWPSLANGDAGTIGPEHRALVDIPNIHFKFTQINFDRFAPYAISPTIFVRHMVDIFGAHRLMWGSDYGNSKLSYEEMVAQALSSVSLLTPEEQTQVLCDNGKGWFLDGWRTEHRSRPATARRGAYPD